MIRRTQYIVTEGTNPYRNLAMEETLLHLADPDTCILYLWQNQNTVVIGKNQNLWQECRVKALTEDGGYPSRRMSGGGAVFHDLGNLNFTFLVWRDNYDVEKQCQVIIEALRQFGLVAEQSGRNDILVDGRKISGNAFYRSGNQCYHHGTILMKTDKEKLGKYLSVSREKLQSKGVESVKSRVANLCDFLPDLTIGQLKQALITAFGQVYQCEPQALNPQLLDQSQLEASYQKFSSWDWIYGRKIAFRDSVKRRFSWGEMELGFDVEGGMIRQCQVFSDAMDDKMPGQVEEALKGCPFTADKMQEQIRRLEEKNPWISYAAGDICGMLEEVVE